MPKPRRRVAPVVLLCLGELLLAALVVAGYWVVRLEWLERHAHIVALVPADVDGDGTLELIVVYSSFEGSATNLVEAVDLERDRVLWSAEVSALGQTPSSGLQAVIAGAGRLAIARGVRRYEDDPTEPVPPAVGVYDLATGAPVWSFSLPPEVVFCHQSDCAPLAVVGDLLLVETRSPETLRYVTFAFDLKSGQRLWRTEANRNGELPIPIGDDLLLVGGEVVVNRTTGRSSKPPRVKPIGRVADGRYLASRRESGPELTSLAGLVATDEEREPARWSLGVLSERDGTYQPLKNVEGIAMLPDAFSPWRFDGNYRDRLLEFGTAFEGPGWIESRSVLDGAVVWRSELPIASKVVDAVVIFDGGRYDGTVLDSRNKRYMPAVIQHRDPLREQLVVLDLETGELVWRSEGYRGYDPYHDMEFHDGQYLVPVEYGDEDAFEQKSALLILEAATGRFRGAYRIELVRGEWAFDDLWKECLWPWMLADGMLFCGDLRSCC
ncbi:MAG: PQQ-binding-like beta-propeller repeat protein, partial [Deltaproteobacteria bacterium]|nr:PQQ-binding-like beta-propeller repeat protein [Deltaproteobacteria bacterium]